MECGKCGKQGTITICDQCLPAEQDKTVDVDAIKALADGEYRIRADADEALKQISELCG